MNKAFRFTLLAALVLALGACGPAPAPPVAQETPPTLPTLAPGETPPSDQIVIENFNDNSNGWTELGPDANGNAIFIDAFQYHIVSIYQPDVDNFLYGWSTAWTFNEFDLRVSAVQVEGSTDDNEIGVIFGLTDEGNFYEWAYSGDGYVGLFQYVNGEVNVLRKFEPSTDVIQGNTTNLVRLLYRDGALSVYLNGEPVYAVDVPGYTGGYIGLGCGPFAEPLAHCTFGTLVVYPV